MVSNSTTNASKQIRTKKCHRWVKLTLRSVISQAFWGDGGGVLSSERWKMHHARSRAERWFLPKKIAFTRERKWSLNHAPDYSQVQAHEVEVLYREAALKFLRVGTKTGAPSKMTTTTTIQDHSNWQVCANGPSGIQCAREDAHTTGTYSSLSRKSGCS